MAAEANYISDFFYRMYEYREYLKQSVMRDLRKKYKRSVLGYVWTMLHPLGMMAVLAVVFSNIMRIPVENYAVFVFCGILPWTYFQSTTMMSLTGIKDHARLFSQIPVPKYLFILSIAASNLVNFFLALVPLILIMLVTGHDINLSVFAFPLVLLPLTFITIGASLLLAASSVFFEDTLHLSEVAFQALYFLCPVLYGRDLLPEKLVSVLTLNPVFIQIEFMRDIFYGGVFPDPMLYAINFIVSFGILAFCLWVFTRAQDKFLYFV